MFSLYLKEKFVLCYSYLEKSLKNKPTTPKKPTTSKHKR